MLIGASLALASSQCLLRGMHLHRARNPRKSPLRQCAHRHFADYVLANPSFKDDDVRWQFGVPPKGNANFAWVEH